jgi:dihydroneopterin aldolase
MKTRIEIRQMQFYAFHGVSEQERKAGNRFTVDLLLDAPLEPAIYSDRLEDTIDYAGVYAVVKREMAVPSCLLEHAAGRILSALKKAFPQLTAMEIKLAKLSPPFGGDAHSAAVVLSERWETDCNP